MSRMREMMRCQFSCKVCRCPQNCGHGY